MKKSILIISILAVPVIIGVILLFAQKEKQTGLDKVNVRLKWLHQTQFAGFYTAEKKGFYKKNGINATLNPGGVDFPAIQMVSGGAEQFGVTGADQILLAREKGVPVVALAVIYRKSPFVLFSLKGSDITEPKDFVGKKVGVKIGGNEELTYRAMLKNTGIDTSQIIEIPVKYDISPLLSGQIDVWPGYVINEPITAREKGYEVNIIWPSDYGVNLYADTLFTTEDMIKNNPDLVKRFVRATLQGWNYAYNNPDEAVSYTLMYSDQLSREHETKMMQASLELLKPDNKPIGYMNRKIWEDMQKLLLENGFMKNPVNIDEVYTTQFLK